MPPKVPTPAVPEQQRTTKVIRQSARFQDAIHDMSCPSTSPRPSCITWYGAYKRDDQWSSLWPVRQGGETVVALLKGMDIVEGEKEINKAEREDVRRPGTVPRFPQYVRRRAFTPASLDHHHHHLQNGCADAGLPSSRSSTPTLACWS